MSNVLVHLFFCGFGEKILQLKHLLLHLDDAIFVYSILEKMAILLS